MGSNTFRPAGWTSADAAGLPILPALVRYDEVAAARVVLQALKTYGMIVADNGSDWYLSGTADARWNDTAMNTLKQVPGSAFDVVTMGRVTAG